MTGECAVFCDISFGMPCGGPNETGVAESMGTPLAKNKIEILGINKWRHH
jgi:hypothetical protein